MSPSEQMQAKRMLAMLSAYYRTQLSDAVISLYAEDLSDLEFNDVVVALQGYRRNPKNKQMPLPAQIREIIYPEVTVEGHAREIAARIQQAVSKFGHPNGEEAKLFIGEPGWRIVGRFGGWNYLCENLGRSIDVNMFQAQARELAKNQVTFGNEKLESLITSTSTKVLELVKSVKSLPSVEKRKTGSNDDSPF